MTYYKRDAEEFLTAVKNLKVAKSNFNNADPEFFEVANAELTSALEYLRQVVELPQSSK